GNVLLEGKLFVNGGIVNVQTGQALNAGQDFHYAVNGGTPQLYVASGNLNIGGGFSYNSGSDYIDFEMSGGTIIVTANGYTYANSFILTDELGGITVMSGGTIIIQDACLSANPDLDMGGANVKATLYSVTGGTIQFGYTGTQANSTFYGVNAEPSTNYPNLDFESGTAKNVSAWVGGNISFLSIYINPNMTFNASGFPIVTILANNGVFAFSNDGTYTYAGNIFVFAGSVKQLITTTLGSFAFDNLTISNTSSKSLGVVQGPNCSVIVNRVLTLNSGAYYLNGNTLTIQDPSPAGIVGGGTNSYVVSENTSMNSILKWQGITQTPGSYVFPFGFNSGGTDYYLPFTFNITSPAATLGDVSLATYHTGSANTPFAPGVTQMYGAAGSCYVNMDESVQAIVDRWWQITAPTSPTADITFTYAGPEAATMTGNPTCGSTLDAYHWNTSIPGWDPPVGNQATAVTTTGSTGNVTASGISTFSPWVLGLFASPLPIKLLDFTAVYNSDQNIVNLNWITESEKNNKSFTVERSIDGVTYAEIATVAGAGNSTETLNYSSIDLKPVTGIDYYRLKQSDFDGNNTYSDVVPVTISASQSVTVFPNPVKSNLSVNYASKSAGAIVLKVEDLGTGRELNTYSFNAEEGNNTFSIDASNYAAGLYMLQITGADGSTYNDKFIKE
ncbi:MAG TPA: T9SS type A sorting domain-containing protein, partial [Bacteroidia bacterium]|nr:T9SS type A sorting domain-containing protein [Bacteroidia bacterium]